MTYQTLLQLLHESTGLESGTFAITNDRQVFWKHGHYSERFVGRQQCFRASPGIYNWDEFHEYEEDGAPKYEDFVLPFLIVRALMSDLSWDHILITDLPPYDECDGVSGGMDLFFGTMEETAAYLSGLARVAYSDYYIY